ncbi:MAG: hypothetical protein QG594_961 [Bacteroidota bacterium]|nr:hypothetical protein [Bacteroidota bacterium]
MKQKITCEHVELAIMAEFNFRQNLIVPNISNMMDLVAFETDMLVISKSGYATGFEIKVSKADLKADFKKPQHRKLKDISHFGNTGMERYFGKFKYFYYAVPLELKEIALELIPDFCGLYTLDQDYTPRQKLFKKEREAKKLLAHIPKMDF